MHDIFDQHIINFCPWRQNQRIKQLKLCCCLILCGLIASSSYTYWHKYQINSRLIANTAKLAALKSEYKRTILSEYSFLTLENLARDLAKTQQLQHQLNQRQYRLQELAQLAKLTPNSISLERLVYTDKHLQIFGTTTKTKDITNFANQLSHSSLFAKVHIDKQASNNHTGKLLHSFALTSAVK
jgi:Tfp pilus assembly protein PilN